MTSLNLGLTHFWRLSNQTTLSPGVIYNWRPSWVGPANKFLAWKRKPWAGWKESSSSFNSENVDSLLYMSRPVRPATLQYIARPSVCYPEVCYCSQGVVLCLSQVFAPGLVKYFNLMFIIPYRASFFKRAYRQVFNILTQCVLLQPECATSTEPEVCSYFPICFFNSMCCFNWARSVLLQTGVCCFNPMWITPARFYNGNWARTKLV